ncbi:hypothetical protein [Cellvibrio sp. OA-2007]|uniref:hypothetical protein n=1 Tax=Cellvibrio sp. OA-2007 TaxID=529823 RepID=UPI000785DC5D|nr:hypothetical protein [Cellvibrio sp. OA-2007]
MANTNKTKAEILQELESIKGLLLEEDNIPILQEMEGEDEILDEEFHSEPPLLVTRHESVLPGQGSLFEEPKSTLAKIADQLNNHTTSLTDSAKHHHSTQSQEHKREGFNAHLSGTHTPHNDHRPLAKASGENPFLPQHIRERLHGNNPPPLFEYETAKKIVSSTKNIAHKVNKPRQYLVEEVMLSMMPQIERELRHRLFAMSVEDLEKLLNEDED